MKTYNLFISHGWSDTKEYQQVIEWLNQAKEEGKLHFRIYSDPNDRSVSEFEKTTKSPKLADQIASQMKASSIFIVLSGLYAGYKDWIDLELNAAVTQKKYIIGLMPWDPEPMPSRIKDEAHILSSWNPDFLMTSILKSGV